MNAKNFTVGQKVKYAPSKGLDVRVSEICTGKLTGMLVLKIWDGIKLVGTTCVSISEVS